MINDSLNLQASPVQFGTDGWRGILGVDVTLERLLLVAVAATQELAYRAPKKSTRKVIIGYDRRFLAPEFAEAIASAVRACDIQPFLTECPVTTPACSWAVLQHNALGALVVTASHNPPEWLGLKIKGSWGGAVENHFTKAVETRLVAGGITIPIDGETETFDCRKEHLLGLRKKIDIPNLVKRLNEVGLKVIVDSMHGSAAGCMAELFQGNANKVIKEIRINRDPLFGGNPPEPLAKYLKELTSAVKDSTNKGEPAIGIVFDGDGDRIAAVDDKGRFCSTQSLIPLFIEHLAKTKQLGGCLVKTVSGSDLMTLVAQELEIEVLELPVGFKYIAEQMLEREVLLGGEESGGIGFGEHIPERDALYAALILLETIAMQGKPLATLLDDLTTRFGECYYERIDVKLLNNESKERFEIVLKTNPPKLVADIPIKEITSLDGFKLRMDPKHWLMFRFSGTEPLLRIYCEAPSKYQLDLDLKWAIEFAQKI